MIADPVEFVATHGVVLETARGPVPSLAQKGAEPNPPLVAPTKPHERVAEKFPAPAAAPTAQWTNHKSADGSEPRAA